MKKPVYFENLDAIRFIAAIMVIIHHTIKARTGFLDIKNAQLQRFLVLISNGSTGVAIFFVLSGFLITYLLVAEYDKNSTVSIRNFYIRRVLRIWPLYYFVIFFAFVIYPVFILPNSQFSFNVLYFISFLSNFNEITVESHHAQTTHELCSGVTWSVSVEEQFYLFWPLIFALLPRKLWIYCITLTIMGSLFFRIAYSQDSIVLTLHTLSVLIYLGMGGLFAYIVTSSKKVKTFFEEMSTGLLFGTMALSVLTLVLVEYTWKYKYGRAISPLFTSFSFAMLICSQALTKSSSIMNLKNLTFASRWGKYTYGMYLLHPIAFIFTGLIVNALNFPQTGYFYIVIIASVSFILTLILSKVSYDYFESKFLRLKERFEIIKTENPAIINR